MPWPRMRLLVPVAVVAVIGLAMGGAAVAAPGHPGYTPAPAPRISASSMHIQPGCHPTAQQVKRVAAWAKSRGFHEGSPAWSFGYFCVRVNG